MTEVNAQFIKKFSGVIGAWSQEGMFKKHYKQIGDNFDFYTFAYDLNGQDEGMELLEVHVIGFTKVGEFIRFLVDKLRFVLHMILVKREDYETYFINDDISDEPYIRGDEFLDSIEGGIRDE